MSAPSIRMRAAVVIPFAVAVGVALMGAAALPSFTPDGTATLTVTAVDSRFEISAVTITGECPATTAEAAVHYSFLSVDLPPITVGVVPPLAPDGTFTAVSNFGATVEAGAIGYFALVCTDLDGDPTADASLHYTLPDFLHTVSVGSADLTTPLDVTVDCGTQTSDELGFRYSNASGSLGQQIVAYTGPGVYSLSTPASLGFAEGDAGVLAVDCILLDPDALVTSTRSAAFVITAPAPAPALPATGIDGGWMPAALGGFLLLMGGIGIRTRRVRQRR